MGKNSSSVDKPLSKQQSKVIFYIIIDGREKHKH